MSCKYALPVSVSSTDNPPLRQVISIARNGTDGVDRRDWILRELDASGGGAREVANRFISTAPIFKALKNEAPTRNAVSLISCNLTRVKLIVRGLTLVHLVARQNWTAGTTKKMHVTEQGDSANTWLVIPLPDLSFFITSSGIMSVDAIGWERHRRAVCNTQLTLVFVFTRSSNIAKFIPCGSIIYKTPCQCLPIWIPAVVVPTCAVATCVSKRVFMYTPAGNWNSNALNVRKDRFKGRVILHSNKQHRR